MLGIAEALSTIRRWELLADAAERRTARRARRRPPSARAVPEVLAR